MSSNDLNDPAGVPAPTIGGGLWDYDIESDDLFCNGRWYEIVGIDPDHQTVHSIGDFGRVIHPDDVALATQVDLEHVSGLVDADHPYHIEFRIIWPNGEIRWLRSVACMVRDTTTGHRRAVGCITDITEAYPIEVRPELTGPDFADGRNRDFRTRPTRPNPSRTPPPRS